MKDDNFVLYKSQIISTIITRVLFTHNSFTKSVRFHNSCELQIVFKSIDGFIVSSVYNCYESKPPEE